MCVAFHTWTRSLSVEVSDGVHLDPKELEEVTAVHLVQLWMGPQWVAGTAAGDTSRFLDRKSGAWIRATSLGGSFSGQTCPDGSLY